MNQTLEAAREMLIAVEVGLITKKQLINWAGHSVKSSQNPAPYLKAIAANEPLTNHPHRLDLVANPLDTEDCARILSRALTMFEEDKIDLQTLSRTCEALDQGSDYKGMTGALLWLSSEIDLGSIGGGRFDVSKQKIQSELAKCLDQVT
jgi:hypothetical protein